MVLQELLTARPWRSGPYGEQEGKKVFGTSIGKRLLILAGLLPLATQFNGGPGAGPDPIDTTLMFGQLAVYKYEGYQPYDVVARVVDGNGDPVSDASVSLVFAQLGKGSIPLKSTGKGFYLGCDLEWVDAPSGALSARVIAAKKGMSSAEAIVSDQPGNACGLGESQIFVSGLEAAKPDGVKQPLDVVVRLKDESGTPVSGATVRARATDFHHYVDVTLTDMGGGKYMACTMGLFDTKGADEISIHVNASAPNYRSGDADGTNKVGFLCAGQGTPNDDTTTQPDAPATASGDGR